MCAGQLHMIPAEIAIAASSRLNICSSTINANVLRITRHTIGALLGCRGRV